MNKSESVALTTKRKCESIRDSTSCPRLSTVCYSSGYMCGWSGRSVGKRKTRTDECREAFPGVIEMRGRG